MEKRIEGYEKYGITDTGDVTTYHRKKPRKLKPRMGGGNHGQYERVNLSKDSVAVDRYIHRLVAEAFIPNPESPPEVNHKDLNTRNNKVENLEWCTRRHNLRHARDLWRGNTAKIGPAEAEQVRDLGKAGMKQKDIAQAFGISQPTVSNIVRRQTWAHGEGHARPCRPRSGK